MNIYEHRNVFVYYDSELEAVCQTWQGFCPGLIFRDAVQHTLEFMKNSSSRSILSDITEQRVVSPFDQEYADVIFSDFIREFSLAQIAFISREKSVVRACAGRFERLVKKKFGPDTINFFTKTSDALYWLSVNEVNN